METLREKERTLTDNWRNLLSGKARFKDRNTVANEASDEGNDFDNLFDGLDLSKAFLDLGFDSENAIQSNLESENPIQSDSEFENLIMTAAENINQRKTEDVEQLLGLGLGRLIETLAKPNRTLDDLTKSVITN